MADVLDADDRARAGLANDNLFKFFGRDQAAGGAERLGHFLVLWSGGPADLARGRLKVLFFDRADNVGGNEAELGHHVRLKPHAHAIVGAAEEIDLSDSRDAQQLIAQVDAAVIDKKV